jgi:hypothetical protein
MVRDMIIETAQYKIGGFAERVHIIGAFYLIHEPRGIDVSIFVCGWIFSSFHVMRHKKSEQ